MQIQKDPLVKYKDMNISGQSIAGISIACLVEVIIELIIQPAGFNWYNYLINALILVLFVVISPYYEDIYEYSFYLTAGSMLFVNLLFKTYSIYGIIVMWILNGIFFLILFDFILNVYIGQSAFDLTLQSVVRLGALLFLLDSIVYLVLNNSSVNYQTLVAYCSIIMLIFGYVYSKGKLQFIGAVFFLGTIILNIIVKSGIDGYSAGYAILTLFSVLSVVSKFTKR